MKTFIEIEDIPIDIAEKLNELLENSTVEIPFTLLDNDYANYFSTFEFYICSCNTNKMYEKVSEDKNNLIIYIIDDEHRNDKTFVKRHVVLDNFDYKKFCEYNDNFV